MYMALRNRESKAHEAELSRQLAQSNHELTHDELTGLLNRRGMENLLQDATPPRALLYIDGTNQKAVNDRLGHDRGDTTIIGTAGVLQNSLRPDDTVARFYGDEFLALLSNEQRGSHQSTLEETLDTVKGRIHDETQAFLDLNPDLREVGFDLAVGGAIWESGMSTIDLRQAAEAEMYAHKEQQHQANGKYRP